jgi:transaldolase
MSISSKFEIDIYADGASESGIKEMAANQAVKGFTTNPTLMRKDGVEDYETFAKDIITWLKEHRPDTNISLEVFVDDYAEMYRQAKIISGWGKDSGYPVFVKIPVVNTRGEGNYELIRQLHKEDVPVNVTAVFTSEQVNRTLVVLSENDWVPSIISIFAGRIADTLVDPEPLVRYTVATAKRVSKGTKVLWASTREQYNYIQANDCGADIITMTNDQIRKLHTLTHKPLKDFSIETVKMFYNDALASGYNIG